jgi:hypothetical protein
LNPQGYWFKSSKFEIEPSEDSGINPRIYGKQLAAWLKVHLEEYGHGVEDILNEDWGRCLMCQREPFLLWVGCGNVWDFDTAQPGDPPPSKESMTWHCFATAEVPFWKRMFRRIDTEPAVSKLNDTLGKILRAETDITIVEQP